MNAKDKRWRCGERRTAVVLKRRPLPAVEVHGPGGVAKFIEQVARPYDQTEEHVGAVYLDARYNIIGWDELAKGQINSCSLTPASMFKAAILCNAYAVVMFHNHPSGDPTPSDDDISLTKRFVRAGDLLNIKVLDHLVFGGDQWVSMSVQKVM